MLLLWARLISSSSACEKPAVLQLLLSTRTLAPVTADALITKSSALIALLTDPTPLESRNFAAIRRVVQFTPVTPTPLLPAAPMMPDTCVPWPLSSIGRHVLVIALNPCVPCAQLTARPPTVTVNGAGADHTLLTRSG